MWVDPIVEEVRAIRRRLTDEFGGDIHAICEDIRRRERESGRTFVTFANPKATEVVAPILSVADLNAGPTSPAAP